VQRLDAALVSGGLTPLTVGQTHSLVEASKVILISNRWARKRRQAAADQSGVEPPHSKIRLEVGTAHRFNAHKNYSAYSIPESLAARRLNYSR
jgi:hypothetical protein